jgi:hypothetical protein
MFLVTRGLISALLPKALETPIPHNYTEPHKCYNFLHDKLHNFHVSRYETTPQALSVCPTVRKKFHYNLNPSQKKILKMR